MRSKLCQLFVKIVRSVIQSLPFQSRDRLYTSESDARRRRILTYKDGPLTEIKIFLMVVDP